MFRYVILSGRLLNWCTNIRFIEAVEVYIKIELIYIILFYITRSFK